MTDVVNGDDGGRRPIKRALVSVYDKTDLLLVADALVEAGAEIVSTGSTAESDRRGRSTGHPDREGHRISGMPGRSGQDLASDGPCWFAR